MTAYRIRIDDGTVLTIPALSKEDAGVRALNYMATRDERILRQRAQTSTCRSCGMKNVRVDQCTFCIAHGLS
jgi:hypothetical protein